MHKPIYTVMFLLLLVLQGYSQSCSELVITDKFTKEQTTGISFQTNGFEDKLIGLQLSTRSTGYYSINCSIGHYANEPLPQFETTPNGLIVYFLFDDNISIYLQSEKYSGTVYFDKTSNVSLVNHLRSNKLVAVRFSGLRSLINDYNIPINMQEHFIKAFKCL